MINGVLFDFDETLTAPGAIDFEEIRRRIGMPPDRPVLEYIAGLAERSEREAARAVVDEVELEAAAASRPNAGAEEIVEWLRSLGLPIGIMTRNSRRAIDLAFQNFVWLRASHFDVVITRDDPVPHKPRPDGVLAAAEAMGVPPQELLVVGDYVFDILAGRGAGATTVLLDHGTSDADEGLPDLVIHELDELREIVRLGRPLAAGKVPADLLEAFLAELPLDDKSVLLPPRVGEDVTVVDPGSRTVAIGADPITFTAESLGLWALIVNANDVAVCGATPRWFLATLLLPVGTSGAQVVAILDDLRTACAEFGVTLCGGHTEVTDAVVRPVLSGMMVGTLGDRGIIDKRQIREGDEVIITKRVAVEGTALLAGELRDELLHAGVPPDQLLAAADLRGRLSVVAEAAIAACAPGVSAMHDVTEGGLATALSELAAVCGHDLEIDLDCIPYYPQTRLICERLGIDPLGLIGSGSLLIACAAADSGGLMAGLAEAGIEAASIGRAVAGSGQVRARRDGVAVAWPGFAVDEVARVLAERC